MRLCLLIPMLLATGCVSGPSGEAVCDGTKAATRAHAAALAVDGGDMSVVTGQALIARLDAGCRR